MLRYFEDASQFKNWVPMFIDPKITQRHEAAQAENLEGRGLFAPLVATRCLTSFENLHEAFGKGHFPVGQGLKAICHCPEDISASKHISSYGVVISQLMAAFVDALRTREGPCGSRTIDDQQLSQFSIWISAQEGLTNLIGREAFAEESGPVYTEIVIVE